MKKTQGSNTEKGKKAVNGIINCKEFINNSLKSKI